MWKWDRPNDHITLPPGKYVFDIEANGLLEDVTQVWCISIIRVSTGDQFTYNYTEDGFEDFITSLSHCDELIGHKIISYDIPVLEKLYNVCFDNVKLTDTLVMSRVDNPDRLGDHSMANWMKILKLPPKVEQEQWIEFDPNMVVRCEADTLANLKVYEHLNTTDYSMEMHFAKICQEITTNAIKFDIPLCQKLITQLEEELYLLLTTLEPKLPDKYKQLTPLKNIFKKDESPSAKMTQWIGSGNPYKIIGTMMERWVIERPNVNNPETWRSYLLSLGWKPRSDNDAWNFKTMKTPYGKQVKVRDTYGKPIKTTPKLPTDELDLISLRKQHPDFELVAKYLERKHRLNVLRGYIINVNHTTGRISMGLNSCGAATRRVTHSVVANIPRVTSFFGKEMRSLFIAPPDKVLVGCDMSGLELRILAHHLNDSGFTKMVIAGDVHTYLYEKLQEYVPDRSSAKNLTYAFLYGAGNEKLGSMCELGKGNQMDIGKQARHIYLECIPNLKKLIIRLENSVKTTGGFKTIDDKYIKCRSAHAALNTLCQADGSIIAKKWTCLFNEMNPTEHLIVYMHDELIVETFDDNALQIGEDLVQCIKLAGEYFKLNCPLTGEYKIGMNWSEIH